MELSPKAELFSNPIHPYTKALLSAIPIPDPLVHPNRIILEGDIPSPVNPPEGCRFQTRCYEIGGDTALCEKCCTLQPGWVEVVHRILLLATNIPLRSKAIGCCVKLR